MPEAKQLLLPDGAGGEFESTIPFLPTNLYEDVVRFLLPIDQVLPINISDSPNQIINAYIQSLNANLNKITATDERQLAFIGTMPSVMLHSSHMHLFKRSAWLNLTIQQTIKKSSGVWFTLEQVEKYQLKLQPTAVPTYILWRYRHVVAHSTILVVTALYNESDLFNRNLPKPSHQIVINWRELLNGYLEEYSVELLEQQATVVKKANQKDVIYRNESFLNGTDLKYSLVIPEEGVLSHHEFNLSCLIALSVFAARSKLVTQSQSLIIANLLGFMLASQLAEQIGIGTPIYSVFQMDNLKYAIQVSGNRTNPAGQLCQLVDDFWIEYRKEIFELNHMVESVITNDGISRWLHDIRDKILLQKKMQLEGKDDVGSLSKACAEQAIHTQSITASELFENKLKEILHKNGIHVMSYTSEYMPIILSKFDAIMARRDLSRFPDEFEFYDKIETPLISGLMITFKTLADLEVKWQEFEKEIANTSLPEPKKDFIIRKKALEFKKYLKNIFFVEADPEVILEEANVMLDINKI